ncbi:MAG: shikimate kinase [Phycisphaerales bacterium]
MTDPKPNLILIGLRASGKSTLGAQLATTLDRPFIDLDDELSSMLGCSGPGQAIEEHGIDAFRNAEAKALEVVLQKSNQIIALGGGTPTAPGCSDILTAHQTTGTAHIIYLRANPQTLRDRLETTNNTDRPALVGKTPIDEVQTLFDQRDDLYQPLAESTIHTDGLNEETVLAALLAIANAGL